MANVGFEQVDKIFPGGAVALSQLTLEVADGELLVVVGPSGCGKSTLLRLLAGLEAPTGGRLRIGGRVVNDLAPQARNVAMVFQDYALYPHMSVRANLEFPLRMRGTSRNGIAARVLEVAELLGMQGWLDRLPRQLSGGQQQRVAMGRALVREPAVFLMDEPLSNLDAQLRVEVREEIAHLQRRTGTTMLYVTHDQSEAMTLGDRVAVLGDGRLQQVAPAREVYDHPSNVFVAGFVGTPPMNLFASRLTADGNAIELAGHPLRLPPDRVASGALDGARGGPVTAGIRPESLRIGGADGGSALPGRVRHVELLGHEALVHVVVGGEGHPDTELTVRLPGMDAPSRDENLELRIDPASVHLFDATGRALERQRA